MKIPGFTKFACPSILLDRRDGIRLPGETKPTPEPVKRMPSRFQKLKKPPAKFELSRMASKPRAVPSRGLSSPEAQKIDARNRIQSRSQESSAAAICALMSARLPAIGFFES